MPKSRAHSKKKISSPDGLAILRNWQTHKTALWFVSFTLADMAGGPEVTVASVSPVKFTLRRLYEEDPAEDFIFNFSDVDFWELTEDDVPINLSEFSRFLGFRCRNTDDPRYLDVPMLLAERAVVH